MHTLPDKLTALGYENLKDFECSTLDDGTIIISEWFSSDPIPDDNALNSLTEDQINNSWLDCYIKDAFELKKKDIVLIQWINSRTGNTNLETIQNELKDIWKNIGD